MQYVVREGSSQHGAGETHTHRAAEGVQEAGSNSEASVNAHHFKCSAAGNGIAE